MSEDFLSNIVKVRIFLDTHLPLLGKTAVVTGAGRGIGRAIACELVKNGARPLCVSRTFAELEETVALAGGQASAFRVDISAPNAPTDIMEAALDQFGRLDILVHCAGMMQSGRIDDMDLRNFDLAFATNVRAPYALTQAALPRLRSSKGEILFINSSIIKAANTAGRGVFAATQAALKMLADTIRDEVNESDVRVTSIMPGTTATPRQEALFSDQHRIYKPHLLLQPADVAQASCAALLLPRTAETTDIYVRPMQKYVG